MKRALSDIRNENYVAIDKWDDQVGAWYTIDEADNASSAENKIKNLIQDGETYSVLVVRREVFAK